MVEDSTRWTIHARHPRARKLVDSRGKTEAKWPKGGDWKQARRASEAWRISLSDVSNYVYVSLPVPSSPALALSPPSSPRWRCLITPRCRPSRAPQRGERDALAAPAPSSFVAGRRSLKSENNKIHLTRRFNRRYRGGDARLPGNEAQLAEKARARAHSEVIRYVSIAKLSRGGLQSYATLAKPAL